MTTWPTLMTFQLTNNSKSLIILGTRYPQLNYLIIMFLNPFFKKKLVRFRVQQSVVILITLFKKSSTQIRSRASQGYQFLCFYIVRALVRTATVREQHRSELKYVTKLISGQVAKQYRLPQKKKTKKKARAQSRYCVHQLTH